MLLELYPPDVRGEVALHLSRTEDAGKEKVREVEEAIRSRLDYVVGGVEKLVSVLNLSDPETQQSVLGALEEKNPKAAARLQKKLKSFQDILRTLRPATILALIQQVDFTTFARVLKAEPEDLQQKIVNSLTEGASERLREELEYSRPFGAARLKREKLAVLRIIRRMSEAGLLEEEEL
jgi:flagellar motor switch protein FliG